MKLIFNKKKFKMISFNFKVNIILKSTYRNLLVLSFLNRANIEFFFLSLFYFITEFKFNFNFFIYIYE